VFVFGFTREIDSNIRKVTKSFLVRREDKEKRGFQGKARHEDDSVHSVPCGGQAMVLHYWYFYTPPHRYRSGK
jgi:hypothetical protein